MSTQSVNADRRGPKDLMDLATKANALKGFIDARVRHENAIASGAGPTEIAAHQRNLDNAFEDLMDVHDNDQSAVADTARYVHDVLVKGKGN